MVEYLVAKIHHQLICIRLGTQATLSCGLHLKVHTCAYALQTHPPHHDGQKPLTPLVHMSFSMSVVYVSIFAEKANPHSGQSWEKS